MQVATPTILGVAMLGLAGLAVWSAFATSAAADAASRAGVLADAYGAARFSIGAEESLERKYRLEPGPEVRKAHLAAKIAVDTAMATVMRDGRAQDISLATDVLRRNAAYLIASDELFVATDQRNTPLALQIDHTVVDPVFTAMQTIVYAAGNAHGLADEQAQQSLLTIGRLARWVTSLTVGVGALLILVFARSRRRFVGQATAQDRLSTHRTVHDTLTGLPNRTFFSGALDAQVALARSQGGSVGVVLLDLDRFKEINDTLGHFCGDRLLQQIGSRIRPVLATHEVLARLGSDEFAVLLCTNARGSHAVAEMQAVARRALTALHDPFDVDGVALSIEASAGIAVFPDHCDTGASLLQRADIAMYVAKRKHTDVIVYDPALDHADPHKLAVLARLRTAVDRGELVLHYQPLVDIGTNAVRGAEALVRWQNPEEGLMQPAEFIPLAEGSGFIHVLTRHVLRLACLQAEEWRRAGKPLVISVNISARCLLDITLPDAVAATLCEAGLPASLLKLEITESAIISDPRRAQDILNRLHSLGVALSLDDFGTGFSSLAYLRHLPVQELKIDRSFVKGMLTDLKDAIIVRTGAELAARLGLESVAEGVEDEDTLIALGALGCTVAQGYHLGRPMPSAAFEQWRASWAVTHPSPRGHVRRHAPALAGAR